MNPHSLAFKSWYRGFRALRRWHRYEVVGLEHILVDRPYLLVGYHGRPIAFDLCMLTTVVYEHLGYLPHAIMHATFKGKALDDLGFVTADGPDIEAAVAANEHIVVTPGATREGCRSFRDRYRVNWGDRVGYLRLALRYGLPIVPIAGHGVDDAYIGLNDGYRLGKRLGLPQGIAPWVALGPLGLAPLSPSFPVKVTQHIGPPIDLTKEGPVDIADRAALNRLNQRVKDAVQSLLDRRKGRSWTVNGSGASSSGPRPASAR